MVHKEQDIDDDESSSGCSGDDEQSDSHSGMPEQECLEHLAKGVPVFPPMDAKETGTVASQDIVDIHVGEDIDDVV